mgnify:CR=1 FL=1
MAGMEFFVWRPSRGSKMKWNRRFLLLLSWVLLLNCLWLGSLRAEKRRINADNVAVFDRPLPVGAKAVASLPRDRIVVVLERRDLMTKIRTGDVKGWVPAFSLSIYDGKRYKKVQEQTDASERIKELTRRDAKDMSSSAGALGVHELSEKLAAKGDFSHEDTVSVDRIMAYRLSYDVETFLKKGSLGRYMFAGGAQ